MEYERGIKREPRVWVQSKKISSFLFPFSLLILVFCKLFLFQIQTRKCKLIFFLSVFLPVSPSPSHSGPCTLSRSPSRKPNSTASLFLPLPRSVLRPPPFPLSFSLVFNSLSPCHVRLSVIISVMVSARSHNGTKKENKSERNGEEMEASCALVSSLGFAVAKHRVQYELKKEVSERANDFQEDM